MSMCQKQAKMLYIVFNKKMCQNCTIKNVYHHVYICCGNIYENGVGLYVEICDNNCTDT